MAVKISIFNQKGGVAKTTTCKSLAGELSKRGYRVLVIDADPSANLTTGLSYPTPPETEYSQLIIDYCEDFSQQDARISIVHTDYENLDLMPGSTRLDMAVKQMQFLAVDGFRVSTIFKNLFADIEDDYDFIFIDCLAGRNGPLSINALAFSDYVLTPVETEPDSIQGFKNAMQTINGIKNSENSSLSLLGVFYTKVNTSRSQDKVFLERAQETFGDAYLNSPISNSVEVRTSRNAKKPLCYFSPNGKVARQYSQLTDIILERVGK